MADIIKARRIVADSWQLLDRSDAIPPAGEVIVPLAMWRAQGAALTARGGRVGILLEVNDELESIVADFPRIALIAIRFASATDGRGYSAARLLRERHGWRGELRAVGEVLRDQLSYLERCGFDAFQLREGTDVRAALAAFGEFSEAYQTSVERTQPLFRRRAREGVTA